MKEFQYFIQHDTILNIVHIYVTTDGTRHLVTIPGAVRNLDSAFKYITQVYVEHGIEKWKIKFKTEVVDCIGYEYYIAPKVRGGAYEIVEED